MIFRTITAIAALAFASLSFADNHATDKEPTIVDIAVEAGSFETLVTALQAADLVGTLQGDGPFTVFAPTDEAFAALPEGALESLLQDTDKLTQVLTLHVVAGRANAADVVGLDSVTSLQGSELAVDATSGVSIAGANVVQADINAKNGVIHVIDRVILPQG